MVRVMWMRATRASHRSEGNMAVEVQERQYQESIEERREQGPAWAGYLRRHQCGRTRRQSRMNDFGNVDIGGPDALNASAAGRWRSPTTMRG